MYKEEYVAAGGVEEDIQTYKLQKLLNKIKTKFASISVDKQSNKSGSFLFSAEMSSAEAKAKLIESDQKQESIRSAALALRSEILKLPQQKLPSPTSMYTLKNTSLLIPSLVLLFFRTLLNGLHLDSESDSEQAEFTERKVLAMASDAVFNCSKGSKRPWKHQVLGLGLGTLTGSKSVLTLLNRLGHSISYDDVKRLETEFAFSCSNEERETPNGLHLNSDLATGTQM